jgi:hypothetical protein
MKRFVISAVLFSLCLAFPDSLISGTLGNQGKEWLDAQKEPAAINVNGAWETDEFGPLHLRQDAGSRDVNGIGGSYELSGVVSGKRLYLLFLTGHTVEYCAVLTFENESSMDGTYSNRVSRWNHGERPCQEKSRPMYLTKK